MHATAYLHVFILYIRYGFRKVRGSFCFLPVYAGEMKTVSHSAGMYADARGKAMQQWHNTPQYVWFFGQVLFLYTHATEKRQEKKGRRWDDIGALF